jgi:hypothetical protein
MHQKGAPKLGGVTFPKKSSGFFRLKRAKRKARGSFVRRAA